MKLEKGSVVKITDDERKIKQLKAVGFYEVDEHGNKVDGGDTDDVSLFADLKDSHVSLIAEYENVCAALATANGKLQDYDALKSENAKLAAEIERLNVALKTATEKPKK